MSVYQNVTALAKANVYFDGKVISHTIHGADGSKKSLGLIYPGAYHFGTGAAERMEITVGICEVKLDGSPDFFTVEAGSCFDVPANSGFNIKVDDSICEYVCSYLPS